MSRFNPKTPSLDEALASGFANLKVGEENLEPIEKPTEKTENSSKIDQKKPVYGQQIRHVENRNSFTVKPSDATQKTLDSPLEVSLPPIETEGPVIEQTSEKTTLLDAPSSELGEDFDVEW